VGSLRPAGRTCDGDRIGRVAAGSVTDGISCSARPQVGLSRFCCDRRRLNPRRARGSAFEASRFEPHFGVSYRSDRRGPRVPAGNHRVHSQVPQVHPHVTTRAPRVAVRNARAQRARRPCPGQGQSEVHGLRVSKASVPRLGPQERARLPQTTGKGCCRHITMIWPVRCTVAPQTRQRKATPTWGATPRPSSPPRSTGCSTTTADRHRPAPADHDPAPGRYAGVLARRGRGRLAK
jgi:hypothetical protein